MIIYYMLTTCVKILTFYAAHPYRLKRRRVLTAPDGADLFFSRQSAQIFEHFFLLPFVAVVIDAAEALPVD